MTTLYEATEGGIRFTSDRRPGEVRIPNYVYDLWLPLLGATTLGVYTLYCRLERENVVKGLKLNDIARICRIGKVVLQRINDTLAECKFIKLVSPEGHKRLAHLTTEIIVLDPPSQVSKEIIDYCKPNGDYEPVTPWLVNGQVLSRTSDGSNKNAPTGSSETSYVAPSVSLHSDPIGSVSPSANASGVATQPPIPQFGEPETEGAIGTSKDLEKTPTLVPPPPSPVEQVAPPPGYRPFVHPLMIVCPVCGSAHKSWYIHAAGSGDVRERRWYCIMCGQTSAHPAMCFKDDGTQDIPPTPAPAVDALVAAYLAPTEAPSDVAPGNAMGNTPIPAGFDTWKNCRGINQLFMHLSVEGRERPTYLCKAGVRQARKVTGDGRSVQVLCPACQRIAAERATPKAPTARKHDPVFDAIALGSFALTSVKGKVGSRIGGIVSAVKDCTPEEYRATLADDLPQAYLWWKAAHGLSAPREALKICAMLAEWRQVKVKPPDAKTGWQYIEREVEPGRTEMVWVQQ